MNILLLTPIYPSAESSVNSTKVIHYFAKEWAVQGHSVYVIHNYAVFPDIFYIIPKFITDWVEKKLGSPIMNKRLGDFDYELDGVRVSRMPMKKRYPHADYSSREINRQYSKIKEKLEVSSFIPDVIIGHWESPQIPLVYLLKDHFNATSVIVLHLYYKAYILKNRKNNAYIKQLKDMDVIGFRSYFLQKKFEKEFWKPKKDFICYSGIPVNTEFKEQDYIKKEFRKIVYVGLLVARKYPDILINTVSKYNSLDGEKLYLDIIGEGVMHRELEKIIVRSRSQSYVCLKGRYGRREVFEAMKEADCFIMISKNEAFGLVYLEAMLHGCIVIASKREGMDGIIVDKVNGFLCEAGNGQELLEILKYINGLTEEQRMDISKAAIQTARVFSEPMVAQKYLDAII